MYDRRNRFVKTHADRLAAQSVRSKLLPVDPKELIAKRKDAHIDVVLHEDVGSSGPAQGLARFTLEYDALPEIDLDEVNLQIDLLGRRLGAPLVVGAMTGGTPRARALNQRLARAAAKRGLAMALGSQRAMVVDKALTSTFEVRDVAPDLPLLFGNIGAVQLNYGMGAADVEAALAAVGADAVNLHLNPLQEAVQPEGDTRFRDLHAKIASLAETLDRPVMVKEVGSGISERTAKKLATLPIAGVEVAGTGGTSWARVESHRAPNESAQAVVGRRLAGFGVPTATSIRLARTRLPSEFTVIGSGGVRTGMDMAVALALGADAVAMAAPLLEVADRGEEAIEAKLDELLYELRVVCFCTGCTTIAELKNLTAIPL